MTVLCAFDELCFFIAVMKALFGSECITDIKEF